MCVICESEKCIVEVAASSVVGPRAACWQHCSCHCKGEEGGLETQRE